ncbi:hypothetical protein SDC9_144364 [bioreactor metagenome]|uniref:Uncharacterized protein n=1 Tax=bioreactor metagenome TaxID=1076179 RepID=A0A645E6K6_9ZZZZ
MIPVLEVVVTPSKTNSPMFPEVTPVAIAISVKTSGMITNAVNGDNFFFMITNMKIAIIP